jgi:hypothetical protein
LLRAAADKDNLQMLPQPFGRYLRQLSRGKYLKIEFFTYFGRSGVHLFFTHP